MFSTFAVDDKGAILERDISENFYWYHCFHNNKTSCSATIIFERQRQLHFCILRKAFDFPWSPMVSYNCPFRLLRKNFLVREIARGSFYI